MKTIYISTATTETTIALFKEDHVKDEQRWPAENRESEKLLPAVSSMLEKNDLEPSQIDRLVVCTGPGGFTSVRIGVSATNAWAQSMNIPVACVSVFDSYPNDKTIVIAANSKEAWIKEPGKEPLFTHADDFSSTDSFYFTGIVNEQWMDLLQKNRGAYSEEKEQLPDLGKLDFENEIVEPWYYKAPNITWSKKNTPLKKS
ncbi:MAG: tRNA (adenosine(37)-N6)-threonylcarbamoyltransferase complex dimerization subunit type 1 TsaB [Candidatus Gracilibacteria bacterium]|nr:tRNA (adenosine(37)-N6)-threonylcarbamoyltransferase complex dimerization subunit type 1 TsaB [Candidatus Gracilibacteria bacterium]